MELDITHMVEEADSMIELSGSRAEHGQDAGRITWRNSVEYGKDRPLLTTDDMREEARRYFRSFGAWSQEEIDAWSEEELQGIMCQDVAAGIREMEVCGGDYEEYQKLAEAGTVSRNVYKSGDRWYFYVGS